MLYTGKEGKTIQGCPLAKWVIRRSSTDEKLLIVVKNRHGHTCQHSWIVICIVSWEGILSDEADYLYTMLSHKLNKYVLKIYFYRVYVLGIFSVKLFFLTDMEYQQLGDVAQMIHGRVRVRDLTQIPVGHRFHSDVLGQCTITVVNMQGVETCESLGFPYEQR